MSAWAAAAQAVGTVAQAPPASSASNGYTNINTNINVPSIPIKSSYFLYGAAAVGVVVVYYVFKKR